MKSPIEYISQSVKLYTKKENFIFFAKVMGLVTIVSAVLSLLANYLYPVNVYESLDFSNYAYAGGFVLLSILMILFGIYVRSVTLSSVINTGGDIKETLLISYKKLWKYLLAVIVVGLIVFAGAVLLVIPGLVFAVWYSFVLFLVFDQNLSTKDALKKSKSLVKGSFWKISGRLLGFVIFGLLLTVVLGYVPYVGSLLITFIAPLYLLPHYLLYRDLMSLNQ